MKAESLRQNLLSLILAWHTDPDDLPANICSSRTARRDAHLLFAIHPVCSQYLWSLDPERELSWSLRDSTADEAIQQYLGDGYGPINVLGFNSVLSSILIFLWLPLGKSNGGLTAFCIVFGFVSGTQVSMAPACVASITKPNEFNTIGTRMSMMYLFIAFLALPGPSISGALIDATGGYSAAAGLSGGLVMIGAGCYLTSRTIVSRRKGTKWV